MTPDWESYYQTKYGGGGTPTSSGDGSVWDAYYEQNYAKKEKPAATPSAPARDDMAQGLLSARAALSKAKSEAQNRSVVNPATEDETQPEQTFDAPKKPEGKDESAPISEAARRFGPLAPIAATLGEAGGQINEALFGETKGDELTSMSVGQALGNVPGVGIGLLTTQAVSPQAREYISKTPARDVPGLGLVYRGAEAALGALGATNETLVKPFLGGTALTDERSLGESAYKELGITREEAKDLMRGFLLGQNTPEQNTRLETLSRQTSDLINEANPLLYTAASMLSDPLTWLDAGGVLPQIGRMQSARRALEATADVAQYSKAVKGFGELNPLEKIIVSVLQPKNVKDLAKGGTVTDEVLGLASKGEKNVARRAVTPFTETPESKLKSVLTRVSDNVMAAWTDAGRSFDDKLKQVELMQAAARDPQRMTAELKAFMGERGIVDSLDNRRAIAAALDFKPTTQPKYAQAKSVLDGIRRNQETLRPKFNEMEAGILKATGEELGGGYQTIFDTIIDQWKTGRIDVAQAEAALERVAGYRLAMEFTEHAGAVLGQKAGISAPNAVTRVLDTMRAYEGLVYVGSSPAVIVNNLINNAATTVRHGVRPRTMKDIEAFWKRIGYRPDVETGKKVGEAIRGAGKAQDVNAPFGASLPRALKNVPGLKQLGEGWQWGEQRARDMAHITGFDRFMSHNFRYGKEIPQLPQPILDFYRARGGEQAVKRVVNGLEDARNYEEAAAILKGKTTWASYKDEIAAKWSEELSRLAGREIRIPSQFVQDALPMQHRARLRELFEKAWERVGKGEDFPTAWQRVRSDQTAEEAGEEWFGKNWRGPRRKYGETQEIDPYAPPPPAPKPQPPEIPLTEPIGKVSLEPKPAPTGGAPDDIVAAASETMPVPDTGVTTPAPLADEAAGAVDVIGDLKARAAQVTQPKVKVALLREWDALFHEGQAEGTQIATQLAVNQWKPDEYLTRAQSIVTRARAQGQTWMNTMADMFEDRAHFVIDQIRNGNPKYNTPEYLDRVANGDALTKLLRGGENGFDWTKLEQPYEYRPYESFAQYRKRVTDAAIERDFGSGTPLQRPDAGDTGAAIESGGTGSAARTGNALGESGATGDVVPAALSRENRIFAESLAKKYGAPVAPSTPATEPYETLSRFSDMLERAADKSTDAEELAKILESATGTNSESRIAWGVANNPYADASTFAKAKANEALRAMTTDENIARLDARRAKLREQRGLSEGFARTADEIPFGPRASDETLYDEMQDALDEVLERAKQQGPTAATDPTITGDWDDAMARKALEAIEQTLSREALNATDVMPPMFDELANEYLKNAYMPSLNTAKQGGNAAARYMQEATTLNYDKRWNIDDTLLLSNSFAYWWLHTLLNYSKDFIDHPAMLAYFVRLRENLDRQSEGMPERYKHRVEFPMPFGGELGESIWVDPLRPFLPAADVFQLTNMERASYQALNEDGTPDYNSAFQDLFGIHMPYKVGWALATGKPNELQNIVASLPAARLLRGLTQGMTPGGIGLDGEYDKFYLERALKELVAEGTLTDEQAKIALLQQKGKDWDLVKQRAGLENYGVREISGLTGMRGYAFTPGEQKFLEGNKERERLKTEAVRRMGGNPNMDYDQREEFLQARKFYDSAEWQALESQYPELETSKFINLAKDENGQRMPEDKVQEERVRAYHVQAIWDVYYNAPELTQKVIAAELGDEFGDLFLAKPESGKRDYSKIPMRTLLGWANAVGALVQDMAGEQVTPAPAYVDFPTAAENKAYQSFYDEVANTISWEQVNAWGRFQASLDKDAKNKWFQTADGKKYKAYLDARDKFYADNPNVVKILEEIGAKKPTTTNANPTQGQALNQAVIAAGLNWETIQSHDVVYDKLPSGTGARTRYLLDHPDYARYKNLVRSIYGDNSQQTSQYGNSSSFRPTQFSRTPYQQKFYPSKSDTRGSDFAKGLAALGLTFEQYKGLRRAYDAISVNDKAARAQFLQLNPAFAQAIELGRKLYTELPERDDYVTLLAKLRGVWDMRKAQQEQAQVLYRKGT